MDEDLIIETWDVFKEYIPEKNRETAATHFVDFLLGKDVETSILEGLMGYDPYLDQAIEDAVGSTEDHGDEEDEWGSEDEDH